MHTAPSAAVVVPTHLRHAPRRAAIAALAGTSRMRRAPGTRRDRIPWEAPLVGARLISVPRLAVTTSSPGCRHALPRTRAAYSSSSPDDESSQYRDGQDLVFTTDRGRPLGWRDVDRDFNLRLAKAGVREIRFHDLRHTNATLQLEAGIHPKVVQERLGHSDIGVTLDIYSHVTPALGRDAAQRLDEVFDDEVGNEGDSDTDADDADDTAPTPVP
jgi:integrase